MFLFFLSSRCEIWKLYSVASGGSPWVRDIDMLQNNPHQPWQYTLKTVILSSVSSTVAQYPPPPSMLVPQAKPIFLLRKVSSQLIETPEEVLEIQPVGHSSSWVRPQV